MLIQILTSAVNVVRMVSTKIIMALLVKNKHYQPKCISKKNMRDCGHFGVRPFVCSAIRNYGKLREWEKFSEII